MADDRARRIARQHVQTDALLGVEAVPRRRRPPEASEAPETPETPEVAQTAKRAATPRIALPTGDKRAMLQLIDEGEVRGCTRCALCEARTQTVFGEGNPDADLMFIGEGPGQTEDELGRPFVGRAGELLDKMIVAMGLRREDVYITNVVKCRPPNNRPPTPEEAQTCWTYLERQVRIVQPRAIVTLGAPAAKRVLDTATPISRLRGTWQTFTGVDPPIPVMPTFHPAYLLRQYTRENREKVWSDLQQVMAMFNG